MILETLSVLACSTALLAFATATEPTFIAMGQALFAIALGIGVIDTVKRVRLWKRYPIKIRRSSGTRAILRGALILTCYGLMALLLSGVVNAPTGFRMSGMGAAVYLFMTVPHFLQSLVHLHAVEVRDGWYRLGAVHPAALAELNRLQATARGNPGT